MSLPEESNHSRRDNEAFSDYRETGGKGPERPECGCKIDLSHGRIKSIEVHEGSLPGAETERIPTYEILLDVVPDYREIHGLRDFSISTLTLHEGNDVDVRWVGNDIGLGVIDSLNADQSLKASILELLGGPLMIHHLQIKAEPSGADLGFLGWFFLAASGIHPTVMPETGPAQHLTISAGWLGSSGRIPDIPLRKFRNCFVGIARHLMACAPEPTKGRNGDNSAVSSVSEQYQVTGSMTNGPHIIYAIAVFALLSFCTLGIGVFAFYSALASPDWLGANGKEWVVIGGIAALSLGFWGSTVTVNRVSMMKAGLHYLNGKVGRMWVTTDDKGNPRRYYIRVEGLPFKVSRHVYEWLSEGHQVVVAFRGQAHSQTVARVEKLYRTFLTLDENKMKSHVPVVTARDDTGGRPEQFTDRFDDRFD